MNERMNEVANKLLNKDYTTTKTYLYLLDTRSVYYRNLIQTFFKNVVALKFMFGMVVTLQVMRNHMAYFTLQPIF